VLKAVIFDVDGTLVKSEPCSEAALIAVFAEHGLHVESVDFGPFIGGCELLAIETIAADHGLQLDPQQAMDRKNQHYLRLASEFIKPINGVHQYVEKCWSRKLLTALATSAFRTRLGANLRVLGFAPDDFDCVLSGDDVKKVKPDPAIFLMAAEKMGVLPSECLVVEDAINGLRAARAAGCRSLALTTSFPAEKLTEADWIAADFVAAPDAALNW
jgi:HAD superfamily hydrolase (TIGR01509 family)